ncbi:hypothetical protein BH09MYX1_BH09MYX1_62720 [soil metagenome]
MAPPLPSPRVRYERRRPERTALYEVVRDNLETLYGAIEDGALDVRIAKHARKELEAYLECGLLCRGFARLFWAALGLVSSPKRPPWGTLRGPDVRRARFRSALEPPTR